MSGSQRFWKRTLFRATAWAACVAGGMWAAAPAMPQTPQAGERVDSAEWKRGYNGLSMLCAAAQLQIETNLRAFSRRDPGECVVVILGRTRSLPLDVVRHVERGGAALIASDRADLRTFGEWGVAIVDGPRHAVRWSDMYAGRSDCPLVTQLDADHFVTGFCQAVASNRPGALVQSDREMARRVGLRRLAELPPTRRRAEDFIYALETPGHGGRAVFVADPSVFTNQMLTCADNTALTWGALQWLADQRRRHVLIISNGDVDFPLAPDQMEVALPPPTPEEVMEALRDLPPEALLEFGNAVVTATEDEGVINELLTEGFGSLPRQPYLRVLILLATGLLVALWLTSLLCQGSGEPDPPDPKKSRRRREAWQRLQAAKTLVEQLRIDLSGGAADSWDALLRRAVFAPEAGGQRPLLRGLRRDIQRTQRRSSAAWTSAKLQSFEWKMDGWRKLCARGLLRCRQDSELSIEEQEL